MTNKQLLMFAAATVLAPAAYEGTAGAENFTNQVSTVIPAPVKDTAPTNTVQTADGPIQKLRRTDQEQAGNEMESFALFGDGKTGFVFAVTTELQGPNGPISAPNKVQLSATPFSLSADPTTHAVSVVANTAAAKFLTNNNGNERRNANNTTAMTVNGGSVICAKYNFQPNNTNNTSRYMMCVNQAGAVVLPQTRVYHKNNDDCGMHQDGQPGVVFAFDTATNTTKVAEYDGCNGNGQDDGWVFVTAVTCNSPTAPTSCTVKNVFDVSVCPREERSRGSVSISAADPSFAVATWTEGNTQPQRNGVWMAAIDLSSNASGSNQQQTILWKKQIAGKSTVAGSTTYAQRAIQERILQVNATTGALEASPQLVFHWGDAKGNNNTNNGKGGTYLTAMYGVALPTRAGMTWVAPPVDLQYSAALGVGNTHIGMTASVFGTTDHLVSGVAALAGSMDGGGNNAALLPLAFDATTKAFTSLGKQAAAPQDMHLYPNYLGNNPGNQGRNHSAMMTVANPFLSQGGSDAFLLLSATTGKTMATIGNAAIKLTGLMTVTPVVQTAAVGNNNTPGGSTPTGDTGNNGNTGSNSSDPGTTLGGCNAGGAAGGLGTFLLIGLAAFIRRRR